MPEFETLSREEKLDLVLKTILVYGNGVIADKAIAQLFHSNLNDVSEITDLLKTEGFIYIEKSNIRGDWGQLTITPEGRLFASNGGYAGDRISPQVADITDYVKDFHLFSKRTHVFKLWFFWATAIALTISVIYTALHSSQ